MKKLIAIFYFQVGVNVIGLPDIRKNRIFQNPNLTEQKSKFF